MSSIQPQDREAHKTKMPDSRQKRLLCLNIFLAIALFLAVTYSGTLKLDEKKIIQQIEHGQKTGKQYRNKIARWVIDPTKLSKLDRQAERIRRFLLNKGLEGYSLLEGVEESFTQGVSISSIRMNMDRNSDMNRYSDKSKCTTVSLVGTTSEPAELNQFIKSLKKIEGISQLDKTYVTRKQRFTLNFIFSATGTRLKNAPGGS